MPQKLNVLLLACNISSSKAFPAMKSVTLPCTCGTFSAAHSRHVKWINANQFKDKKPKISNKQIIIMKIPQQIPFTLLAELDTQGCVAEGVVCVGVRVILLFWPFLLEPESSMWPRTHKCMAYFHTLILTLFTLLNFPWKFKANFERKKQKKWNTRTLQARKRRCDAELLKDLQVRQ